MKGLKSDIHLPIADLINDYVEGALDGRERLEFEDYLSNHKEVADFVEQSQKGKALSSRFYSVSAADDFEEKLFRKIGQD